MDQPSLDGIRMKIGLARKDFDEFNAGCDRFVRDDPKTSAGFQIEQDAGAGTLTVTAHIPSAFPPELGGLAGRIFRDLRSALDNLAWQLVLVNGGAPGKHTEFPVFKDEAEFERRAPKLMAGMSDSACATIEGLQPFNVWAELPDHATLWKLHELSNIDKHRLPHLACLYLARCKGSLKTPAPIDATLEYLAKTGPIEHGAPLARFRYDPAKAAAIDHQMQVNINVAYDPAIRSGELNFLTRRKGETSEAFPIRTGIDQTFDYVSDTLAAFADEFP